MKTSPSPQSTADTLGMSKAHDHKDALANIQREAPALSVDGWKESAESPRTAPRPEARKRYPLDALPGPFALLAKQGAARLSADPTFLAGTLLTAAAAAIGNTRELEVLEGSWTVPSILWLAIVAESGENKSAPRHHALRAFTEHDEDMIEEDEAAEEQYARDTAQHEKAVAAWKSAGKRKEADMENEPPVAPKPPPLKSQILEDVTIQAVQNVAARNPRGLLLAPDELAILLDGMTRHAKGNDESVGLIPFYEGKRARVNRSSGDRKRLAIPRANASIVSTIQPETLEKAFTRERRGSGVAARFLPLWPERTPYATPGATIPQSTEDAVSRLFSKLFALEPGEDQKRRPTPRRITTSAPALEVMFKHAKRLADEAEGERTDIRAAFAKVRGYVPRFALVIHLCRWAAGELEPGEDVDTVSVKSMKAATTLGDFHARETIRIYDRIDGSVPHREAAELADFILSKSKGSTWAEACASRGLPAASMNASELTSQHRKYRDDPTGAAEALDRLAKRGFGRWWTPPQGKPGRPPAKRLVLHEAADPENTSMQPPATAADRGLVDMTPPEAREQHDEPEIEEGWI